MTIPLEQRVREALEAAGIRVRRVGGPDSGLEGSRTTTWELGPRRKRVLAVPQHAETDRETEGRARSARIYLVDHVTEQVGERWIREGRQFADTVGNAHIVVPGLRVRVLGMRARESRTVKRPAWKAREWRGATLRTLFHLLSETEWIHRPIRDIAKLCDATPRTVMSLIQDLERDGQLVRIGRGDRRFHPDARLYDRWIEEYGRKLHPRLELGRYAFGDGARAETLDLRPVGAVWGGESAAARLGADLKPAIETIYVRDSAGPLIKTARLRATANGPVSIREAFWSPELRGATDETTPPLLVVADLMVIRDSRCYDAATQLRQQFL
ncbi:MAG: hypothetical protein H6831_00615 [Planctomycetes bacterium]|nr:hypothetical protein [Planctomycetota bacterium]MCB9902886.1 hypothetical protein [Planctomycetota bacterium]